MRSAGQEIPLTRAPHAAQNVLPLSEQPTLAAVDALTLGFTMSISYANVSSRCGPAGSCGPSGKVGEEQGCARRPSDHRAQLDYGYATASVTLSNVNKSQSLFYQVRAHLAVMTAL
jgi:hypothetical protein